MSDTTRRGFLVFAGGSAAAAVGVAAGAAIVGPDDAPTAGAPTAADVPATDSFVVYVKDVRRGRMAILVGDREVLIEDRELASKLAGRTTA